MNWEKIALAAAIGAVGAVVAYIAARRIAQTPDGSGANPNTVQGVVFVITFGLLQAVASAFVTPHLETRRVRNAFRDIPPYQALERRDPAAFDGMVEAASRIMAAGKSQAQAVAELQAWFRGEIIPRYLRTASDDSLLSYVRVMVTELEEHRARNPEACYLAIHPDQAPAGSVPVTFSLSASTQQADLTALTTLIDTAGKTEVPIDAGRAEQFFDARILPKLAETYGDDLSLLGTPQPTTQKQARVCDINIQLFQQVLALPAPENAVILRYLLLSK